MQCQLVSSQCDVQPAVVLTGPEAEQVLDIPCVDGVHGIQFHLDDGALGTERHDGSGDAPVEAKLRLMLGKERERENTVVKFLLYWPCTDRGSGYSVG